MARWALITLCFAVSLFFFLAYAGYKPVATVFPAWSLSTYDNGRGGMSCAGLIAGMMFVLTFASAGDTVKKRRRR